MTCLPAHHQSAGELSGDGWSHIHCNCPEGKPPVDVHQVSFKFFNTPLSLMCVMMSAFYHRRQDFKDGLEILSV